MDSSYQNIYTDEEYKILNDGFLLGSLHSFGRYSADLKNVSQLAIIQSFLNFSNDNPKLWNDPAIMHSNKWLSEVWPCNLN